MLHHDHRVAQIAELSESGKEPRVVALVESDGRLVQDVQHAHEARAYLRGEPDALRLAARERLRRSAEREVVEPHVHQKTEPVAYFLEDRAGDSRVEPGPAVRPNRYSLEELERVHYRQLAHLADVAITDGDGERFRAQPPTAARAARSLDHVCLELGAYRIGRRIGVAAFDVGDHALPRALVLAAELPRLHPDGGALAAGSVEDDVAHLRRELAPRRVEVELELLRQRGEDGSAQMSGWLAPRQDHAFQDRDPAIAEDEILAHFHSRSEAAALLTGAERRVERELARLELRKRGTTFRAAVALGKDLAGGAPFLGVAVEYHLHEPLGELQRSLDGVGEAPPVVGTNHQPIHDHRNAVVRGLGELRRLRQLHLLSVHQRAYEALLSGRLEEIAKLAFPPAHERREHLDTRVGGPAEYGVGYLTGALALDRPAALRAVRKPRTGVEEPEIVVDLGDRSDRGARVVAGRLLLDRDGRREPLDGVDIGLLHEPEELASVGRERLDVAPLPLGVDGVEGERRLPRAREPRDDGEAVTRDRDIDVAQIMLAGPADYQLFFGHSQVKVRAIRARNKGGKRAACLGALRSSVGDETAHISAAG